MTKKNQIQCTLHTRFTSRFVAAVRRAAAAVRITAAVRRAAFADRFHHAPSTTAKECNYLTMISVKSVGLMIVGNQLLSLQSLKRTILLLNIKSLNISRAVSYCYETEFEI